MPPPNHCFSIEKGSAHQHSVIECGKRVAQVGRSRHDGCGGLDSGHGGGGHGGGRSGGRGGGRGSGRRSEHGGGRGSGRRSGHGGGRG
eukprot:scaffold1673_cov64-Phaeocystis_antarctica.AAC.1